VLAYRDSLTGLEYLKRASDVLERGFRINLHAYQSHVFLDWRELHPTAEQPWDRLCDQLDGRGIPNLDDALVDLELRPVHDALRKLLDPATVRLLADLAEHPRAIAAAMSDRTTERERGGYFDQAWARAEAFLRAAQAAYAARLAQQGEPARAAEAAGAAALALDFRKRLRAAMRLPSVEALSPLPWSPAARRMLPSPSPQFTATAMWGPILGWHALELLAESIDAENPEPAALDLFDRLRLREPFAQAFATLGFEAEEGWRVAARIKVVLLTSAGVGKVAPAAPETLKKVPAGDAKTAAPGRSEVDGKVNAPVVKEADEQKGVQAGLAPSLWLDPDVRWLTGVHRAEGHDYLLRERYEELLWWMLMPSLLRLAGESAPSRAEVEELSRTVDDALAAAEAAGYRVDALLGSPETKDEKAAIQGRAGKIESKPAQRKEQAESGVKSSIDPEPGKGKPK
jgi:hypothetical protein